MKSLTTLIALAAAAIPAVALSHVTAAPAATEAGAYTQTAFRVGHGCEGQATTALRIEPPAGLEARARPAPGWTLAIEKAPDGSTKAATWRGKLPDAQFEVFELLYRAPDKAGPLNFTVVQTCGAKVVKWSPTVQVGAAATAADPHAGHR